MRKIIYSITLLTFILAFLIEIPAQTEQTDCKVLVKEISDFYSGECKDGLANGEGIAKGIDTYEGKFKNGLPHGKGKYVWENGNYFIGKFKKGKKHGTGELYIAEKDNIIKVKYKNDELVDDGTRPYTINNSVNVNTVKIRKYEEILPGTIEIIFDIAKNKSYFNTLELSGSSGHEIMSVNNVGFKNVTFPFTAEIKFIVSGEKFIVTERCIVEFTIHEPGGWRVIIQQEQSSGIYTKDRLY
ncbi:MAG: MORN repeat-containing protein [Bacteroidales bacterium]